MWAPETGPISVMVSSMNGDERARAGSALREAPVVLDVLRSLPGRSVLVFDRDLRYVLAAGGALKQHGYAWEDLEGRFCAEAVPADRWALVEPLYRAALEGEEGAVELDSLDGASRFTVEVGPLRNEAGDVIGGVAISCDVTAVRRLEAEVGLRERRLHAAFESSPVGIVRADADGRYIEVNDAFAEMLGYARDALVGMTFREVTHPEDVAADEAGRVAFIAAGGPGQHRGEKRYIRADGEVVWGLVSAAVIEADEGLPEFYVQMIDITARKRLENRFRGLLESAPDGIVVVDDQGEVVMVNAQTEKMFGYDRDELLGERVEMLVPDSARRGHEAHRAAFSSDPHAREMGSGLELRGRRKDGSEFPVEISLSPLETEDGTLISSAIRDVSERKRLEGLAGHLAAVVESSADAIISKTTDGTIVSWNPGAEQLYGYSEAEVQGRSIGLLVPEGQEDEVTKLLARVTAGERIDRFETTRRRKDGSLVDVSLTISAVRDANGRIVGASTIARDITEQKRSERELAQARRDIDRFFGLSLDVMAIASGDGHFVRVNPAFEHTLGYSIEDLTGRPFAEFVHPDDLESTLQTYAELLAGSSAIGFENRYRCKDGSFRWLLWNATAIEHGFVYCTARDITERKQLEDSVREAEELLALSYDESPLGMTLTAPGQAPLRINRAFADMLGYTVEELRASSDPKHITHPDDRAIDEENVRALIDGDTNAARWEKRYVHADGHIVSAMVSVSLLRHPDGTPRLLIAGIEDISERKLMEQRLRQLADHDSLTGLRNRRTFDEAMLLQVGRSQRYGEKAILLLIDLDAFKKINDTHGHKTGDDVLKAVAGAIKHRVRTTDFAARIGGDEFAVLLPHTSDSKAGAVARDIEQVIAETTIQAGATAIHPSASIGIGTIDENTRDTEAALAQADRAMYTAKRKKPTDTAATN